MSREIIEGDNKDAAPLIVAGGANNMMLQEDIQFFA